MRRWTCTYKKKNEVASLYTIISYDYIHKSYYLTVIVLHLAKCPTDGILNIIKIHEVNISFLVCLFASPLIVVERPLCGTLGRPTSQVSILILKRQDSRISRWWIMVEMVGMNILIELLYRINKRWRYWKNPRNLKKPQSLKFWLLSKNGWNQKIEGPVGKGDTELGNDPLQVLRKICRESMI